MIAPERPFEIVEIAIAHPGAVWVFSLTLELAAEGMASAAHQMRIHTTNAWDGKIHSRAEAGAFCGRESMKAKYGHTIAPTSSAAI